MAKKKKKAEERSWIVRAKVTSIQEFVCNDCTKEQAEDNPFAHMEGDPEHIELKDWEVQSIVPNE